MKAFRDLMRNILIAAFALLVLLTSCAAKAGAVAEMRQGGAVVTLYDEPCKLSAADLPYRATWSEGGKTLEGCFSVNGIGLVLAYFSDRTIAGIPVKLFKKVTTF